MSEITHFEELREGFIEQRVTEDYAFEMLVHSFGMIFEDAEIELEAWKRSAQWPPLQSQ